MEITKIVKFAETESTIVVNRGWGYRVQSGKMKRFWG